MFRAILRTQLLLLVFASAPLRATLVVNGAQPITERVTVQVITTAASDGTAPAPGFGNAAQQAAIFAGIDAVWAQAGIDVEFKLRLANWNNDFALRGIPGDNDPRPGSDLNAIRSSAASAGLLDPSPLVINLFLVRIVPGFSQTTPDSSNGLAFVGDNGIALWTGPNLVSFTDGRDVIAAVLAHEIGHNLDLSHTTTEQENLMNDGSAADEGQRLTLAQIAASRASGFSVPIPEPVACLILIFGFGLVATTRSGSRTPAR